MRSALLIVALALCSWAQPVDARQQTPQEARVNFLSQGEPDSLDPTRGSLAFASEAAVVRQVFEPLLRFDVQLTPQPAAAESYDVSRDGRILTFHLRRDGRWSDGQPVTAGQFEYAWKRLLDPTVKSDYAAFFSDAGMTSAQALDDYTFEVRLTQPYGAFPDLVALWVAAPLRPDIVDADPDGWAQHPSTYVGNGPFVVSEWIHQDHLTLIPNPHYVAHGSWPQPTLTRVTISMATSAEADLVAFSKGERDWTLVPSVAVNQVLNDPIMAPRARQYNELATFWIGMNHARGPLGDVNVRRALAKGIDRTALVRDLATGISMPTTSIIPHGMPGFQEGLGRELDFDPAGGRALLAQSGLSEPDGEKLMLTLSFPRGASGANQRRAEYLQAQWRANLGIEIGLNAMTTGAYQRAVADKDYDLAFGGWSADYPDPQNWFSALFSCGGPFNQYSYCNSTFDQIVARADTSTMPNDRLQLYAQAEAILVQDVPVVPLFVRGRLALIKPWVQGTDGNPLPITAQDDYPGSYFLDKVQILPH